MLLVLISISGEKWEGNNSQLTKKTQVTIIVLIDTTIVTYAFWVMCEKKDFFRIIFLTDTN